MIVIIVKDSIGFAGGVFPCEDERASTKDKGFEDFIPDKVFISMKQGKAKPGKTIVKVGDCVIKGQLIGEGNEEGSVPVYASIGGTVIDIISQRLAFDEYADTVIIERNMETSLSYEELQKGYLDEACKADMIEFIRQIGTVGMGGNGEPTYQKLKAADRQTDMILINGLQCEPWLTGDYRLMLESPAKVLFGAKMLALAAGADRVMICIPEQDKDLEWIFKKNILKFSHTLTVDIDFDVQGFSRQYPSGHEKILRQMAETKTVKQEQMMVFNTATAAAIYDGFYDEKPVIGRGITVAGLVGEPKNLWVPVGTSFKSIIGYCKGLRSEDCLVLDGGPMYGVSVDMAVASVSIATTGITVVEKKRNIEDPCIRCGKCVKACPVALKPYKIEAAYLNGGDTAKLKNDRCIGCGCCSYVCPASRRLCERIKVSQKTGSQVLSKVSGSEVKKEETLIEGGYIELTDEMASLLESVEIVSHSNPHIHQSENIRVLMRYMIFSLLPVAVALIYQNGIYILSAFLISIAACTGAEYFWLRWHGRSGDMFNGSTVVTGILLVLMLPADIPVYLLIAADLAAIIFGKQIFGGMGRNRLNPALTGYIIVTGICWAAGLITGQLRFNAYVTATAVYQGSFYIWIAFAILIYKSVISGYASLTAYLLLQAAVGWLSGSLLGTGSIALTALIMWNEYMTCPIDRKRRMIYMISLTVTTLICIPLMGYRTAPYLGLFILNIISCFLPE